MRQSQFLFSFVFSLLLFGALILILLFVVDPKQTLVSNSDNSFREYHDNFLLHKIELMEKERSFETLILGSSTSEVLIPADMDEFFKTKTFSASIGGGQTPIRYAFFKHALKEFPKLRRIIYMVDFFEFNHLEMTGDFLYQAKLRGLAQDVLDTEPKLSKFKYHISHQIIESVFSVINKRLRDKKTIIHPDGTTKHSMILSPLKETQTPHQPLTYEQKNNLLKQVNENHYTYSQQVLNEFDKLNPAVTTLFKRMVKEARESGIEIHFILAPYQYDFRNKLFQEEGLEDRYHEWGDFMLSLKQDGVYLYPFHQAPLAFDSLSPHWRDGIHFDRYSLMEYLRANRRE